MLPTSSDSESRPRVLPPPLPPAPCCPCSACCSVAASVGVRGHAPAPVSSEKVATAAWLPEWPELVAGADRPITCPCQRLASEGGHPASAVRVPDPSVASPSAKGHARVAAGAAATPHAEDAARLLPCGRLGAVVESGITPPLAWLAGDGASRSPKAAAASDGTNWLVIEPTVDVTPAARMRSWCAPSTGPIRDAGDRLPASAAGATAAPLGAASMANSPSSSQEGAPWAGTLAARQ
jgi:hypothetical protein